VTHVAAVPSAMIACLPDELAGVASIVGLIYRYMIYCSCLCKNIFGISGRD
jgi:hypothetical protein